MEGSDRMRLTREEMERQYPNQWLGLRDAVYSDDDDINFISAEVVYNDESIDQLLDRQLVQKEAIFTWCTGCDSTIPTVFGFNGYAICN